MKYLVRWDYKSSLGGPWVIGEVVEMEAGAAAAINLDSPGVLVEFQEMWQEQERQVEGATKDRMSRGGKKR